MIDILIYVILIMTFLVVAILLLVDLITQRILKDSIKDTERLIEVFNRLPSEKPVNCSEECWSKYLKTTAEATSELERILIDEKRLLENNR